MDISQFLNDVIAFFDKMGYIGVIGIMAIESTFLPIIIPSEVFLITYGVAAYKGEMNIFLVILSASFGILLGSIATYYTSAWLGRGLLYKYGKFFFLPKERVQYWEGQFLKYSKFLVFFGRFVPIPAVKHFVAVPAGLSRMDIKLFSVLTTSGGTIFSIIVVLLGYAFGKKAEALIENYSSFEMLLASIILFVVIPALIYKIYLFFATKIKKRMKK